MRIRYDRAVDAVYLTLADSSGQVAYTYSCDPVEVNGMINLDFDAEGRLIGVEVLGASNKLHDELLANSEDV